MTAVDRTRLPPAFNQTLTTEDIETNSTLQSFDRVRNQLERIEREAGRIDVVVDVGCGRGGFVAALGEHLGAERVCGIELDESARKIAESRGVETFEVDVESEAFPFEDDEVDTVLSFGLLEHLRYYDNVLEEIDRVLGGGLLWLATPNLGGWNNRLSLLTGHQPRNVEVSRQRAVGTLPVYDPDEFLNHVHVPTYGALLELLEHHGFDPIDGVGLTPYQRPGIVRILDSILVRRVPLARRVAVLAEQK